jgi:hypothetical protein
MLQVLVDFLSDHLFSTAQRLNSPALRGFMRKVRWNEGLGLMAIDGRTYELLR